MPSPTPSNYPTEDPNMLTAQFGKGVQSNINNGWIEVSESKEWEPVSGAVPNYVYGAAVIANKNDSDSDGFVDIDEGGHLPASEPSAKKKIESTNGDGRSEEVDLIKITIKLPANSHGTLGSNTGQIRFWKDSKKSEVFEVNGLPNSVCTSASLRNLNQATAKEWVVFAEVPNESDQLNDKAIWVENHTHETYDAVRVTAIWCEPVGAKDSRTYYSAVIRINDGQVDVAQPYGVGDQICIYDDEGEFDSAEEVCVANVMDSTPMPFGWYRLSLDKFVPNWVDASDTHTKGLSNLDDELPVRNVFTRNKCLRKKITRLQTSICKQFWTSWKSGPKFRFFTIKTRWHATGRILKKPK